MDQSLLLSFSILRTHTSVWEIEKEKYFVNVVYIEYVVVAPSFMYKE